MEQTRQFVVVEAEQKENAPELAAHGTLVAFATLSSTSEYTPERDACQIDVAPVGDVENERAASVAAAHLYSAEYTPEPPACQISGEGVGDASGNEKAAIVTAAQLYTDQYITEASVCQIEPILTLEQIEAIITDAARQRIETTYREVEDTRARIERERTAREVAIGAIQDRVSRTKAALAGLAGERARME